MNYFAVKEAVHLQSSQSVKPGIKHFRSLKPERTRKVSATLSITLKTLHYFNAD